MGKWNACCEEWYLDLQPTEPKEGRVEETHYCPTCNTPIDIIYDCSYNEEEERVTCRIVGVKDKT